MSDFRAMVLQRLADNGITAEAIADQIGQVIQGRRVRQTFTVTNDGRRILKEEEVITTPGDLARGAIIFDRLTGGQLGLIPKETTAGKPQEEMVRRLAPAVDTRIISRPQLPQRVEPAAAPPVLDIRPAALSYEPVDLAPEDGDDEPL